MNHQSCVTYLKKKIHSLLLVILTVGLYRYQPVWLSLTFGPFQIIWMNGNSNRVCGLGSVKNNFRGCTLLCQPCNRRCAVCYSEPVFCTTPVAGATVKRGHKNRSCGRKSFATIWGEKDQMIFTRFTRLTQLALREVFRCNKVKPCYVS